jgi:hypothetical protein
MRARGTSVQGLLVHYGSTLKHKGWVALYIARFLWRGHARRREKIVLAWRAVIHDWSKFRADEARGFAQVTPKLKKQEYGSEGYKKALLMDCIQLHYERNRHHPEFHPLGYQDMTRVDRIEMVADWSAAVRRNLNGDLMSSIERNQNRFGYRDAQARELRNIATIMGSL